jgi:hypothetical protein
MTAIDHVVRHQEHVSGTGRFARIFQAAAGRSRETSEAATATESAGAEA